MLPGWAKQTTEFMRSQLLGTRCYIPARSAIHIYACLAYISQSISQAIQPSIAPYMASESDAIYCAQRPPTTNVSLHAIAACCQFDHWLWKFKDWLRNNSSFTSLVCTEYMTVETSENWSAYSPALSCSHLHMKAYTENCEDRLCTHLQ